MYIHNTLLFFLLREIQNTLLVQTPFFFFPQQYTTFFAMKFHSSFAPPPQLSPSRHSHPNPLHHLLCQAHLPPPCLSSNPAPPEPSSKVRTDKKAPSAIKPWHITTTTYTKGLMHSGSSIRGGVPGLEILKDTFYDNMYRLTCYPKPGQTEGDPVKGFTKNVHALVVGEIREIREPVEWDEAAAK